MSGSETVVVEEPKIDVPVDADEFAECVAPEVSKGLASGVEAFDAERVADVVVVFSEKELGAVVAVEMMAKEVFVADVELAALTELGFDAVLAVFNMDEAEAEVTDDVLAFRVDAPVTGEVTPDVELEAVTEVDHELVLAVFHEEGTGMTV